MSSLSSSPPSNSPLLYIGLNQDHRCVVLIYKKRSLPLLRFVIILYVCVSFFF